MLPWVKYWSERWPYDFIYVGFVVAGDFVKYLLATEIVFERQEFSVPKIALPILMRHCLYAGDGFVECHWQCRFAIYAVWLKFLFERDFLFSVDHTLLNWHSYLLSAQPGWAWGFDSDLMPKVSV